MSKIIYSYFCANKTPWTTNKDVTTGSPDDWKYDKLTWLNKVAFSSIREDGDLTLVSMEPSNHTIVDFKVVLATRMRTSDSVKNRVATDDFFKIDPSSNCYSNVWLALEGVSMEEDVSRISKSCIAAFSLLEVNQDGTIHEVAVVGLAWWIWYDVSLCAVEV